jgi:hypothetical protein
MEQKQKSITSSLPVPAKMIERRIYIIRGQEVMLDSDLAELYQVPTKRLNEAIRRNKDRFPPDIMFQLNKEELKNLRHQFGTSSLTSQIAISSMRSQIATASKRNLRFFPYAFTEHGVAMLSSVLHSARAIQMNILIIRAFIQLRKMLLEHKELSSRLKKVESKVSLYGEVLTSMAEDLKKFKNPTKTNAIGFVWKKK